MLRVTGPNSVRLAGSGWSGVEQQDDETEGLQEVVTCLEESAVMDGWRMWRF